LYKKLEGEELLRLLKDQDIFVVDVTSSVHVTIIIEGLVQKGEEGIKVAERIQRFAQDSEFWIARCPPNDSDKYSHADE